MFIHVSLRPSQFSPERSHKHPIAHSLSTLSYTWPCYINTFMPTLNSKHVMDDILTCNFFYKSILIIISPNGQWSNWQWTNIGSVNGLASNRRQAYRYWLKFSPEVDVWLPLLWSQCIYSSQLVVAQSDIILIRNTMEYCWGIMPLRVYSDVTWGSKHFSSRANRLFYQVNSQTHEEGDIKCITCHRPSKKSLHQGPVMRKVFQWHDLLCNHNVDEYILCWKILTMFYTSNETRLITGNINKTIHAPLLLWEDNVRTVEYDLFDTGPSGVCSVVSDCLAPIQRRASATVMLTCIENM